MDATRPAFSSAVRLGGTLVLAAALAGCAPAAASHTSGSGHATTSSGAPASTSGTTTPSSTSSSTTTTTTSPTTTTTTSPRPKVQLTPLPRPAPLASFASPALAGEGQWHRAGRSVDGKAPIYETMLRPPGSSVPAGVAWMDTHLLKAALYSGSSSPGNGPWKLTAAISPTAARTLVAAFNGGFKFPATEGGYYAEGRVAWPLRTGGASLVIYRNGDVTVGQWGRDVTMTPEVVAVRQNLTLLVDNGRPVSGLSPYDTAVWGSTLGGIPDVWRSGAGVTANGALVYVSGPELNVTQLAALLVRAGAVRAMELDINPYWTTFSTYNPPAGQPAAPSNGSDLVPTMMGQPDRFFTPWWNRDFVTMSAR